jgi:hypothetical protein
MQMPNTMRIQSVTATQKQTPISTTIPRQTATMKANLTPMPKTKLKAMPTTSWMQMANTMLTLSAMQRSTQS